MCCRHCGVSFGYENATQAESPSKLSLLLRNSVGGKKSKYKPEHAKRLHIHSSDMSVVSDTCSKLQLPRAAEEDVWTAYNELRNYGLSKPNSVAYAIYRVVRLKDLPILDEDVIELVQMTFQVKRVPTFLAVRSEVSKLRMSSPRSYLITDPRRTQSDIYYLRVHAKKACRRHRNIPYDLLMSYAEPGFVVSRIPNLDTRAKRVVLRVLVRLKVV